MEKLFETVKILQKISDTKIVRTDKKPSGEIQQIHSQFVDLLADMHIQKLRFDNKEGQINEEKILKIIRGKIWVAGGSLSEVFIENYNEEPKDIDIFADSEFLKTTYYYPIEEEYEDSRFRLVMKLLNQRGKFKEMTKSEFDTFGYDGVTNNIETIIVGRFDAFPNQKIEIVVKDDLKMGFDTSIREFYYNGGTILATERALEDVKNKKITIRSARSPVSTAVRAEEFCKRYSFELEPYSYSWMLKLLKMQYTSIFVEYDIEKEIRQRLDRIEKYRENFGDEKFIEAIKNTSLTEVEIEAYKVKPPEKNTEAQTVFIDLVERMRYAQENGLDLLAYEKIKVPKVSTDILKLKFEQTEKLIDEETKKQMRLHLQEVEEEKRKENALLALFDEGHHLDQGVERLLQKEYYLLENHFGIKPQRMTGQTALLFMDIERYQRGEIKGFDVFDTQYFGEEEYIKERLKEEEMAIRLSVRSYLFRGEKVSETNQLEFQYQSRAIGLVEHRVEDFDYAFAPKEQLQMNGDYYQYIEGERYQYLEKRIKQLSKDINGAERFNFTAVQFSQKSQLDKQDLILKYGMTEQEKKDLMEIRKREEMIKFPF